MVWPWRRRRTQDPAPMSFDASIDLDLRPLAPLERASALRTLREQVSALPGAGWVSVESHAASEVRVFAAGSSLEPEGETWAALRRRIEALVRALLPASDTWDSRPPVMAGGFAELQEFGEAMSPSQLEALASLAALAALQRAPEPEPEPPPRAPLVKPLLAKPPPAKPPLAKRVPPVPQPAPHPAPRPEPPSITTPASAGDVDRMTRLLNFVLPVDGRDTAAAAIAHFGSFAAVLAAPEAELRRVGGLGTHSVAAIKLVHAAAVRLARAEVAAKPVLDDPARLTEYLAAALARERVEQFRILFLDAQGMLLADEVQASGTVNHTPVYPREVVRRALALGAAAVVLVHNHPSGDPSPSRDDIEMTKQVRAAASVMSVEVRDHVIIGNGRSLSFRQSGLLK